jgi:polyhydroxyalkanoate synthesis repressor PhaR
VEPKKRLIRKYENRRLYDTENSRYVNLEDIAAMVREGIEVQVIDSATGEDLTRVVLTQIVVDHAKTPGSGFPLDMLRQMVIASGRAGQESFLRSMQTMYDVYRNSWRALGPALSPFDFMQAMTGAGGRPPGAPAAGAASQQAPPPESPPATESQATVDELRRRI